MGVGVGVGVGLVLGVSVGVSRYEAHVFASFGEQTGGAGVKCLFGIFSCCFVLTSGDAGV